MRRKIPFVARIDFRHLVWMVALGFLWTPATPVAAQPLRFAVVGDTQGLAYLEQLTTDMNAHNPAFVIYPGDLVSSGSVAAWNQWLQASDHFIGGPNERYPVPGNHDLPVGGDLQWQETFHWLPDSEVVGGEHGIDQMDYYFDRGNCRFISITNDSEANGIGGAPAALPWLDNLLRDPSTQSKDHVFLYAHHPVTFNRWNNTGGTFGDWWQTMVDSGANVRALFTGHWHLYQPGRPDPLYPNMWEIIIGTGNSSHDGHWWQNRVGYGIVEIDGPRATFSFYGNADHDGQFDDLLDFQVLADAMPEPTGVVAFFGFSDKNRNLDLALNDLGKGNHGNYFNHAKVIEDMAMGNVLSLDGDGDYADAHGISDYNLDILRDLTISVRANFDSLAAGPGENTLLSHTAMVGPYTDASEMLNQPYNLRIRDDKRLVFFWERQDNIKQIFVSTEPATIQTGQWHEYRITRNSTTGEVLFFVDNIQLGDPLAFDPLTELPTGGQNGTLHIGINYNRDDPNKLVGGFNGLIDEVVLWNIATTDPFQPPLLGDVNLDGTISGDGLGDPASDDLAAFAAGWMAVSSEDNTYTRWTLGDLNLDGRSTLDDWGILRQAYIHTGLGEPVWPVGRIPEPSSLVLCIVVSLILLQRKMAPSRGGDSLD